jgi:hypothetical protein
MFDRNAGTGAEAALLNAADKVKDSARGLADDVGTAASSAAYDEGSALVARAPGSALLAAGLLGFALGVFLTKGSRPSRNILQEYYDRYIR